MVISHKFRRTPTACLSPIDGLDVSLVLLAVTTYIIQINLTQSRGMRVRPTACIPEMDGVDLTSPPATASITALVKSTMLRIVRPRACETHHVHSRDGRSGLDLSPGYCEYYSVSQDSRVQWCVKNCVYRTSPRLASHSEATRVRPTTCIPEMDGVDLTSPTATASITALVKTQEYNDSRVQWCVKNCVYRTSPRLASHSEATRVRPNACIPEMDGVDLTSPPATASITALVKSTMVRQKLCLPYITQISFA
ncbi:hypothetical protein J6590_017080 [Homalodisca vitripennis]|nr:hypothetical protein J6590_017080 [Homalodisca vitripennis]